MPAKIFKLGMIAALVGLGVAASWAPDYAHWHGFFELQQDLYKLEQIYQQRLASGAID